MTGATQKGASCPVCGSVGIRNDAGKLKNPKAPDYKCSKKGCKFSWDKQTRKYEPSEYITGWWQPKEEDIARANHQDDIDDQAHHLPEIDVNEEYSNSNQY